MLELMKQAALQAGAEILQVYNSDFEVYSKADSSPLTEADLRADKLIRELLSQACPNIYIWSEESVSEATDDSGRFFLVDPLDGTKEFLKRNGEFTVNIALIVDGDVELSVICVPVLGELFSAKRGEGAWFEKTADFAAGLNKKQRLDCTTARPAGRPLRILGSRSHGLEELEKWISRLNCEHELVSVGSSLKFCRIAQGLADVYPRFGPTCQWDTAAAQGILEAAGGAVVDADSGKPLKYGLERAVLNPDFVAAASQALLTRL